MDDNSGAKQMRWSPAQIAIAAIGVVHVVLLIGEVFPWDNPYIMTKALNDVPPPTILLPNGKSALPMVVHNAGIYNGIVAAALFATLMVGKPAFPIQVALLSGGIIAGVFGAWTLSPPTIAQAVIGAIALGVLLLSKR
jgi:uncharacterized membrane protein